VASREGVPFVELDHHDPELLRELLLAIERVARRGDFIDGEEVPAFERQLAGYCEVDHAIGVSSGTDALVLCLRALGIGPGDEVLVPTNSFVATAEAVALAGATPCLLDVDPVSRTITAELVERSLSRRTRCVIPVHLYGRTADVSRITELAHSRGIAVIEDACQASRTHPAALEPR
jgi:dTDP-4-amino-4,6-dideoxygalactose transaminase